MNLTKTQSNILQVVLSAMCLYMVYLVFATSLQSNLWEAWPRLTKEPWFTTTMVDFYFNIAVISLWAFYKEKWTVALLWTIGFITLGSITTLLYVILQLRKTT